MDTVGDVMSQNDPNLKERQAMIFAIRAHGDQKYGEYPYVYHLYNVVQNLKSINASSELIQAGWLHDTIEDTSTNYSMLVRHFGENIAELVYAVTDELGRSRIARKTKTWPKISDNPKAMTLKLADILANVENAVTDCNLKLLRMYRQEYQDIHSLYDFSDNQLTLTAKIDTFLTGRSVF